MAIVRRPGVGQRTAADYAGYKAADAAHTAAVAQEEAAANAAAQAQAEMEAASGLYCDAAQADLVAAKEITDAALVDVNAENAQLRP